ncbi:hypothetical protein [Mycolicibacter sinensis]|uniref:hypothetical protein n=1 Tax=Mycolicibacter sinensis (strain JDM601) TaxID=875328 RepID=UPI0007E9C2B2|nr:hypothetical protein [Mycolicibacter sinensis]OBH17052.1 hypothetical protein A5694_04855 [Mycolicibacter sinensis]
MPWTPLPLFDEPLPVEITNHTDWLPLWLPFITAIVGSLVALFGIFWSNRTNRQAIDAADARSNAELRESRDRDFRVWQRDTLLQIGQEVVQAAIEAQDEYGKICALPDDLTPDSIEPIDRHGRAVGAGTARLALIGAHDAAQRCRELRVAINDPELVGALVQLHHFRRATSLAPPLQAQHRESHAKFGELLDRINTRRAAFGETIEMELRRTNSPANQTD